jgi:hypothetical protein
MAEIKSTITVELSVTLHLTEAEAGFLEGISGFEHKKVLEAIRSVCGTSYTESSHHKDFPNDGFLSLMRKCGAELPDTLRALKNIRADAELAVRQLSR